MKIDYHSIFNKHKGSPALVIGHGPTLNQHLALIPILKEKGFVLFGCNGWYHIYNQNPHYWVLASNVDTVTRYLSVMNKYAGDTTVLYADSVDLVDRTWVADNLKADYMGYDQKHTDGLPCCDRKCCVHAIPGRLTLQQELQKVSGCPDMYGSGDTVLLHDIAFAAYMGCNPIYVVGMDLDYKGGYAKNSCNMISELSNVNELSEYTDRHLSNLKIIRSSAENLGVSIYSGCSDMVIANTVLDHKKPE